MGPDGPAPARVRTATAAPVGEVNKAARGGCPAPDVQAPVLDLRALAALLELPDAAVTDSVLDTALLAPLERFLARPSKQVRARLVAIGWRIAGAAGEPPPALSLAVEILHAGSLIVDDVQDGSSHRRGGPALHRELGVPLALNAGGFLYFWPFALLRGLALGATRELACTQRLTDAFLRCHAGQALDLGAHVSRVPRHELPSLVRDASALKTGGLMGLALALGGAAAGAAPPTLAVLERGGRTLGIAFQMLDDLENLLGVRAPEKRGEDLRHGRVSWPWAWAADAAAGWEGLRAAGRRVEAGLEPPDRLAARLAAIVQRRGRAEARATADTARRQLAGALGARVADSGFDALVREVCGDG